MRIAAAIWFAAALQVVECAGAQPYPVKSVHVIVGLAPGGATDIVARTLVPGLSEDLGQPLIVENRPGAAGSIGAALAAKAPRDGYTILIVSSSFAANPALYRNLTFDPLRDFDPIAVIAEAPFLLVARPSLPAGSVQELVALAKASPGTLNFASSGSGSAAHLAGELLKRSAGIDAAHITYRGAGPALADVLGGQVDFMFASMVSSLHHVKAGKLKGLAVTSRKRSAVAPEFPTVAEAGLPGFEMTGWFGALAPAGTPAPIIGRLNAALARVVRRPDVIERLAVDGAEPVGGTPGDFAKLLESELRKWTRLINETGVGG